MKIREFITLLSVTEKTDEIDHPAWIKWLADRKR